MDRPRRVQWRGGLAGNGIQPKRRSLRSCGPDALAEPILSEWTTRSDSSGAWAIVVVEACGAGRFVELLDERCRGLNTPSRLALIGAGGKGTTFLGRFRDALAGALNAYESNDRAIRIRDLVSAVEDRLRAAGGEDPVVLTRSLGGATPIRRRREFDQDVTAPLDVYRELRAYLEGLPEDKKSHFIPKAQGAEQGELAWFFEGRAHERRQICAWLRGHATDGSHGLLVVTGAAGSGKSALLGNLVVHATPQLRDLLISTNLIEPLSDDQAPGDDVFDDTVLLTGLSTSALVTRLVKDAGFGEPPAGLELSQRIDWLLDRIRERPRSFTLLTDALDEAQDPFAIAGSVLRRLAAVPGCRVIVGTRRSTNEGPDLPEPADENLLDALGGRARFDVVTVEHDPDAVRAYVRRRLTASLEPSGPSVGEAIDSVAENIAGRDREFLYARLAVHELLATSTLLTDPARAGDLAALLARDHRELFRHAVDRLATKDARLRTTPGGSRTHPGPRPAPRRPDLAHGRQRSRRPDAHGHQKRHRTRHRPRPHRRRPLRHARRRGRPKRLPTRTPHLPRVLPQPRRTMTPTAAPRATAVTHALLNLAEERIDDLPAYLRVHLSGHLARQTVGMTSRETSSTPLTSTASPVLS